jgi:hypothetical protein
MAFGHYLRRQREERDMTLTELARRVESPSPNCPASSANVTPRQITDIGVGRQNNPPPLWSNGATAAFESSLRFSRERFGCAAQRRPQPMRPDRLPRRARRRPRRLREADRDPRHQDAAQDEPEASIAEMVTFEDPKGTVMEVIKRAEFGVQAERYYRGLPDSLMDANEWPIERH